MESYPCHAGTASTCKVLLEGEGRGNREKKRKREREKRRERKTEVQREEEEGEGCFPIKGRLRQMTSDNVRTLGGS